MLRWWSSPCGVGERASAVSLSLNPSIRTMAARVSRSEHSLPLCACIAGATRRRSSDSRAPLRSTDGSCTARVTASWASSPPLNPPEVPSASPRSWLSPGPRPARSSSRSTCPSVRDPRVTERCVPSRLDSCIGDDPARRRGARPRSPGDASGLRAHRFRARCLYRGLPHLVASLARRPPDGRINPKRRENTTRA